MPADHPPVKDQPWEVVAGSKEFPALSRVLASISTFLSRPAISPFTQLLWKIFQLPYPTIATVVSCICFVPAYLHFYPPGPTSHVNTATYDSSLIQALILAFVSVALGDTWVVMSHLIEPPHPKFTLLAKRRFFIRLHVFSGITEILFGMCAFFSATPLPAVIGMVVADLAGHFPTSILQTPGLFGTKEITLSAYYVMIAYKSVSAVYLAFNPYGLWPLLSLFLLHHVYVWVRIYYAAFIWLGEMNDYLYTISVLMAGLTCVPAALGAASTLGLVLAILISPSCTYLGSTPTMRPIFSSSPTTRERTRATSTPTTASRSPSTVRLPEPTTALTTTWLPNSRRSCGSKHTGPPRAPTVS